MNTKLPRRSRGTSLIEVMIAIVVLAVVVIGALVHRSYATLDVREATMHTTSARIAVSLCESWRGVKGSETYEPTEHFGSYLPITTVTDTDKPEYFNDFTELGIYSISLDGSGYRVALGWKDVSAGLRALNVVVVREEKRLALRDETTSYAFQWGDEDNEFFRLTTYVATD